MKVLKTIEEILLIIPMTILALICLFTIPILLIINAIIDFIEGE